MGWGDGGQHAVGLGRGLAHPPSHWGQPGPPQPRRSCAHHPITPTREPSAHPAHLQALQVRRHAVALRLRLRGLGLGGLQRLLHATPCWKERVVWWRVSGWESGVPCSCALLLGTCAAKQSPLPVGPLCLPLTHPCSNMPHLGGGQLGGEAGGLRSRGGSLRAWWWVGASVSSWRKEELCHTTATACGVHAFAACPMSQQHLTQHCRYPCQGAQAQPTFFSASARAAALSATSFSARAREACGLGLVAGAKRG